jgi:hypothetical protein
MVWDIITCSEVKIGLFTLCFGVAKSLLCHSIQFYWSKLHACCLYVSSHGV